MDGFEFYPLLNIFSYLEDQDFLKVKLLNRKFRAIMTNKLTNEIVENYGDNITEYFYEDQINKWYSPIIIQLKPENVSWKKLYFVFSTHYNMKGMPDYMRILCRDNKLFQLQLLYAFNKLPTSYDLDLAAGKGHLEIIKFYAPNLLPTSEGAWNASINGHNDVLNFLRLYRIYPTTNVAIGYNALNALTTGTHNVAIGTNNVAIGYNALTT